MPFLRILALGSTAIAVPFVVATIAVLPLLFIVPVSMMSGLSLLPLAATFLGALSPVGLLMVFWWVRGFFIGELKLIKAVGVEKCLYSVGSVVGSTFVTDSVTYVREVSAADGGNELFQPELWSELSVSYSRFITLVGEWVVHQNASYAAVVVSCVVWWWWCVKFSCRVANFLFWSWVTLFVVVAYAPAGFVSWYTWTLLNGVFLATPAGWPHLRLRLEWCRMWLITLVLDCALMASALNEDVAAHYSERLAGRRRKVGAVFRVTMMRSVHFISNLRLPAFVRNRFQHGASRDALVKGREIMAELGWPVNVDVEDPPGGPIRPVNFAKWADWHVADTSFATGIRQMKLHAKEALQDLAIIAPAYARTEEYRTYENELESTARYFQDRRVDFSLDILDDVWAIVKPIFQHSRLTKFGDIIYLWEKKYSLGFWMTDPKGRRKLSRRSFIAKVGMPWFKRLWAKTFMRAAEIAPVAHLSVKDEYLSPLKWAKDVVRTIIGSPISHYIGSTVFAHQPNHSFRFQETPIKVGMPLTGYWMGRLFDRHSRFHRHIEGDFTAFDSTIEGPVKEVIRAIRKRGFSAHKDHMAICDLIDSMYDQIDHQFLGFTTTGSVFRKGSGLTTGHSSTSMDNSVACIVFYVAAWKALTGLSAREFMHFNELSTYGDDHVLSTMASAPTAWKASNIAAVMAKWGVTNNVAEKPLDEISFLGKLNSALTPALEAELLANGVRGVTRAIWHDKTRLVGKLTGKLRSTEPTYRATRLMSYLQLTAHHPEVYAAIVRELAKSPLDKIVKNNFGQIPTYAQIMQGWYKPVERKLTEPDDDPDEAWNNDGRLVTMGRPSLLDHVLQVLAVVPDMLNPVLFNHGPTRAMVGVLSPHLSWVLTFLMEANGITTYANVRHHLSKTPYRFVDTDVVLPQRHPDDFTSLLVRHWLFLAYTRIRPRFRGLEVGEFLIRKSADLAFLCRGQVITDLPSSLFPLDCALICAALSWVSVPYNALGFLREAAFPDIAALIDVVWNRVLSTVWTAVPANFSEVDAVVAQLGARFKTVLVEAPTGSGKSTALVAHLALAQHAPHRKLIVIEPRTLLVVGLTEYVSSSFGIWCTGATTGVTFDPRARVWFMTPQSFLGHLHLMKKEDLFMIDECHVNEPLVSMLAELLPKWGFRTILATATPSVSNKANACVSVSVPIASVYTVTEEHVDIADTHTYLGEALAHANSLAKNVKTLMIVDSPEQVDRCVAASLTPAQGLSSRHSPILKNVNRFFATNVVDVGVTIPGLRVLITPNWVYGGSGTRWALSESGFRQRRGRLGRTNNGVLFVYKPHGQVLDPEPVTGPVDAWAAALSAGISPAMGWKLDPAAMTTLFKLEKCSPEQLNDFARVSHIFLTNFRALKALEVENMDRDHSSGRPAVMVPTTSLGHFSGSVPQDLAGVHTQAMSILSNLLGCIQRGDNAFALLKEKLATVRTGPLYRVANVINGLANDPSGWRPELKGAADNVAEPDFDDEIKEIHRLLSSLQGT